MVQDSPSRKLDQYIVRFPDGMRDHIKLAAEENNRSMNAEIVARLDAHESLQGANETLRHENAELTIRLEHAMKEAKKYRDLLIALRLELSNSDSVGGALGAAIKEETRSRALDTINDNLGLPANMLGAGALSTTLEQLKRIEEQLSRVENMERLMKQLASGIKNPDQTPTKADE